MLDEMEEIPVPEQEPLSEGPDAVLAAEDDDRPEEQEDPEQN